jgi:probable rRNA maturation factor
MNASTPLRNQPRQCAAPSASAYSGGAVGAEGGSDDGSAPSRNSAADAGAGDADIPPEPEPPHTSRQRPTVEVVIDSSMGHAIDLEWLSSKLRQIAARLQECEPNAAFASVIAIVVTDERMTNLHREHCDIDSSADVLTFVMSEPGQPIEVEIAICGDEAARRAAEFAHTIERELLLYILHGLLHCCGYDDHSKADFARMHKAEDAILDAIGVGRTFDTGRSRPRLGENQ